ncbi:hypothetical protein BJX96DRAFT_147398 [Aspergillus floccosus]
MLQSQKSKGYWSHLIQFLRKNFFGRAETTWKEMLVDLRPNESVRCRGTENFSRGTIEDGAVSVSFLLLVVYLASRQPFH